jgi:ABC-2 type transport system permease protein
VEAANLRDVEGALLSGRADVALVIPVGFGRSILRREEAQLQLLVDGADSTVGTAALNYARGIAEAWGLRQAGAGKAGALRAPPIVIRSQVWYNPELESRNFMVPGILALLLMVITMLLSSLAIVKERELGTLEQLNVTPIRPRELIIGKLIPFVIIGLVDVTLVIVVSRFLFAVPLRGSVPLLYLMSVTFLATTLGLGLFISTVSENQQQAMMTAVFFVMVPMTFLSGFAFPIESMPRVVQYFTYLIPLRYYFVIIRGIFLKGAGLAVLWEEALALLVSGLFILAIAAARFRKRAG